MSISSTEYNFRARDVILGAQMLFVAFGALVLVPLLTGLNPNVALFTAGVGTLIFQLVTGGKVPVFLASSFAFIAPIIYGVQTWGIPSTLCGLAAAGVFYVFLSLLISWRGTDVLRRILPPVVTGPVIMVIGLILAPVAVFMAMGKTGDGSVVLVPEKTALIVSMISLGVTVAVSLFGKGWLKLIPILSGITAGYITCLFMGLVDFTSVAAAPWIAMPAFTYPEWNLEAILFIVPVAIAPAIEHFGDVLAIGSVSGKDYVKDPGIHRTMLGDGLATSFAAFFGGPPNTTYSEVTGAVALIKVFNPAIMTWAAIVAIALAFVGKVGAFLQTIPVPVMGGIMVLLFGAIMVVGMNTLVRAGEDLMEARNLAIVALIVIFGVGGMSVPTPFSDEFRLGGIGLAGILGVFLNLVLPRKKKEA
ncbi:uracil-xanthine permease family protein [Maridesulfovibrio ferrireducens]|uniref:uracil-xanthine permease family protein n=1 Tax=Maridesulfovibrio ferrireducens TaxID=246191 RepID=UPI001A24EB22|nr:uracil-xanthine permease family protein [Maridesulfovibrio ferrireducens]MBI9111621.1 uracil-xanthine permease [Maridesulfovibrio ferrireducens]